MASGEPAAGRAARGALLGALAQTLNKIPGGRSSHSALGPKLRPRTYVTVPKRCWPFLLAPSCWPPLWTGWSPGEAGLLWNISWASGTGATPLAPLGHALRAGPRNRLGLCSGDVRIWAGEDSAPASQGRKGCIRAKWRSLRAGTEPGARPRSFCSGLLCSVTETRV